MSAVYGTIRPTCPKCGHMLTTDDMCEVQGVDMWALAPDEGRERITCPDAACATKFYVQGGYIPRYTTALKEDDL